MGFGGLFKKQSYSPLGDAYQHESGHYFKDGGLLRRLRSGIVGEEGEELGIDKTGRVSLLGVEGLERIKPTEDTLIVPAPETSQILRASQSQPFTLNRNPFRDFRPPGGPPQMPEPQVKPVLSRNPFGDYQPNVTPAAPMDEPPVRLSRSDIPGLPQGGAPAVDLQRSASLLTRFPQDGPGAAPQTDVGMSPVADRRSAILDQTPAANTPAQPSANPPASRVEARRQQLEDRFAKLLELEGEDVKDKNGRLKSGLLGALRGFLSNGIVGAAYGGARGAIQPEWDEKIKHAQKVLEEKGKLDEAMKIENEFARLDALQARTDANAQKNSPEAREAKTQKELMAELEKRMRLSGGRIDPQDARAVELGQKLGIRGKQGGGFNVQRVRTLRGADGIDRPIYIDGPEDFHYINGDGTPGASLSERDRKFLAIELEKENRQRALDGLEPLTWNDAPPASTQPVPASNTQPGSNPTPTRGNSVLVPSGEKPYPVQPVFRRGGYRGGGHRSTGRGSTGGNQRDIGFAESGAAAAAAQAQEARARAAEHRARGEDDLAAEQDKVAQAWDEKARVENGRLQRAGGSRKTAPEIGPRVVTGGLSAAGSPRQYSEAEIRAQAQSEGKDPNAAVRWARQNGRLKRGN